MAGEAKQVGTFVKYKINRISEWTGQSDARATLARLRRGIGKMPGSTPDIWDTTLGDLPETLTGKTRQPSRGEWAVHTALTLYALHQQGKDLARSCMSVPGLTFGAAVRRLVTEDEDEKRIGRKLETVATADSLEELSHHLRGLVQLLKANNTPLDYPALAEDLYWYQSPESRNSVRLRWGRDFYRAKRATNATDQQIITETADEGKEG